ncbi:MAG: GHKL domain-containing protein [Candidatus Sumerlaeia bacterium]|nr:GHKL domain-containing protein [Candidatus Sumerlaeia bacterium]
MNTRHLTIVTFFGLSAVVLVAGLIASVLLSAGIQQTILELQAANSEEYGQRFAASMEAQILEGSEPDLVLRQFQRAIAVSPAESHRFLCILSDDGEVLCHPNEEMIGAQTSMIRIRPWEHNGIVSYPEWANVRESRGAFVLDSGDKPVQLIRRIPVEGTPWSVIVHTRMEVLREATARLNRLILAILIPTGITMILGGTFVVRLIGRHYERGMEDANALLERRVLERTAELEKTRDALLLKEKVALLGTLVAGIAHEIKNPMSAIQLISESLAEDEEDPDARDGLRKIHASAVRCNQLVVSLLAFARNDPPRRVEVSIQELLSRVLAFTNPEIGRLDIHLEKRFEAGNPVLNVDPIQLEQAFLNLLGNACQELEHRPQDRRIILETATRNGHLVVAVEDNGRGVPKEFRPGLFEPFQTTKREGEGTGLGLSLCKRFVEHHEGSIAYRDGKGGGARFEVDIPLK